MTPRSLVAVAPLDAINRERIAAAAAGHGFETHFFESEQDALEALREAEVAFGQTPGLAVNAPKLKWLCTPSAGVNQFTVPGLFASPEAVLTNSSGAYGVTIAEHIVMVSLEVMRRQADYRAVLAKRGWRRDLPIRSIHGSRIVLLGTGDIGREAALRLKAFSPASITGVNRSGHAVEGPFDRFVPQAELDGLLGETDLLVASLPGTPETFHMLDARTLALLPDHALIVNVGRGTLIDEAALETELRKGRLSAALDVFETEPLPPDSPLWDCPNLLITPHVAGNMTLPYTVERIVSMFLEDFDNYCAGRPLKHRVDLKRGY